ncbi:sulfite exporter TauE/SafE family protein [Elusimicrobiota bacterium]
MELFIIFLGGLTAGILGGLLGIGGGIILMPILRFYVGFSPALAAGTCIMAVFFTTLGGSFRHYKLGHIRFKPLVPVIISGAVSTILFSFIFLYFTKKESWLDVGVGCVFLLVAVRMLIEAVRGFSFKDVKNGRNNKMKGSFSEKITIGSLAGILPGLLGIGTGAILVPAFKFILKAPIKIAIGSSLICFAVNALLSTGFKYFQGYIEVKIAIVISLGTLIGANIGAMINKKFPPAGIKLLFGLFFIVIAFKYLKVF